MYLNDDNLAKSGESSFFQLKQCLCYYLVERYKWTHCRRIRIGLHDIKEVKAITYLSLFILQEMYGILSN